MHRKRLIVGSFVLGLIVSTVSLAGARNGPKPEVFPRDSVAYGRTYGEWSAAWWQWSLAIPVANHPLFDKGGCSVGQSGPVWFLGGKVCSTGDTTCDSSSATRTCTVPAGKALFFPIVNTEDSTLEDPGKTIVELRAFAESIIEGTADLTAEVDEVSIPNLKENFREQSTVFGFTLPQDNELNAVGEGPFAAGTYFPAADDGVYLLLAPLPAGPHMLHFHGAFPAFEFALDITYNLTIR